MNSFPRLLAYSAVMLAIYVALVLSVQRTTRNSTERMLTVVYRQVAVEPSTAAAIERSIDLQKRINLTVILGGAILICALLAMAVMGWKSAESRARSPLQAARVEMAGLAELARTSAAQGEELDRERHGRERAEQDSAMKQQLLANSLEEKLRLGRDLHDGLIQSLYAAGLTLESVRPLMRDNPAEADRRLQQSLTVLNGAIADVRAFITGLKPETLRSSGFSTALESIVADLRAHRDVVFDLRVDDEASSHLSPDQESESLQVVREAVSNSLRHGGADRITIRLHRTDREICLLVQDNGRGFDSRRRSPGHGLGNMQARATRIGATLRIESNPGEGSRIVLTVPVVGGSGVES